MQPNDLNAEIEKLKLKKVELINKISLTTDFDEREELDKQMERIQKQIETLEKFKRK
jgi:hypothetical protein